jgi:DNA-directed RNA polymerase I, II, and III subunit RPABC2
MSDIEDYFSGDDSDSVGSIDSEDKNIKKPFKNPISIMNNNLKTYHTEEDEGEEILDNVEEEDLGEDEIPLDDDDDLVLDLEDDEDSDESDIEDDDEDYYDEQEGGAAKKTAKKTKTNVAKKPVVNSIMIDTDDENEEDNDENYLQKFDQEINQNYVKDNHPECIIHNYDEVKTLTEIVRDSNNIIIDPFHRTIPFLTKYERARILGQRSKQIESGAKPFIKIPENIIDGYVIAELELQQKKIPFILRRPLPNGGCEYWNLRDLELINF